MKLTPRCFFVYSLALLLPSSLSAIAIFRFLLRDFLEVSTYVSIAAAVYMICLVLGISSSPSSHQCQLPDHNNPLTSASCTQRALPAEACIDDRLSRSPVPFSPAFRPQNLAVTTPCSHRYLQSGLSAGSQYAPSIHFLPERHRLQFANTHGCHSSLSSLYWDFKRVHSAATSYHCP